MNQSNIEKFIYYYTFLQPIWAKESINILLTALLALASLKFSSMDLYSSETIWPVNAFLCFLLIGTKNSHWPIVLSYFYFTLISIQLYFHATPMVTILLTGIHTIEGLALAIIFRTIMQIGVKNRQVYIETLSLGRIIYAIASGIILLVMTSALGGHVITYFTGGLSLEKTWNWFFASTTASLMIGPIALSYFTRVHWNYPSLRFGVPWDWPFLFPLWIVFWIILPITANFGLGVPVLTYVLFSALGWLFGSLWLAGLNSAVISIVFLSFRTLNPEALDLLGPVFLVIQIILTLITVSLFTVLHRFDRSQRELNFIATDGPSNIVTLDSTGSIISCTRKLTELTGQTKGNIIGKNLIDALQVDSIINSSPSIPPIGTVRWKITNPKTTTRSVDIDTTKVEDPTMPFQYICAVRDATEALEAEEARLQQIDRSDSILIVQNDEWDTLQCSDAWIDFTGYSRSETLEKDFSSFLHSDDIDIARADRDTLKRNDQHIGRQGRTYRLWTKSGEIKYIRIKVLIQTENGQNKFLLTLFDVTTELEIQNKLTKALKKSESYLKADISAFIIQDEKYTVTFASEAAHQLFDIADKQEPDLFNSFPDQTKDQLELLKNTLDVLETGELYQDDQPTRLLTHKNEQKYVIRRYSWFADPTGSGRLLWTTFENVTELMVSQSKLRFLVERDELTGLLSRRNMKERINQFRDQQGDVTILAIDIDHFKSVNDAHGHDTGDALLKKIGAALLAFTENYGKAIRVGGEEFVIVIPWQNWDEATKNGQDLCNTISTIVVEKQGLRIARTASIGIAHLPAEASLDHALQMADLMQMEAKRSGRNQVGIANELTIEELSARGAFITIDEVKQAIQRSELSYHIQPIWDTVRATIEGFEALIRWKRPDGMLIMPRQFLHALKVIERDPTNHHLIKQMKKDLLDKLLPFPQAYVSFNYSLEQLSFEGAASIIHQELTETLGTQNRQLVIELSESSLQGRENLDVLTKELHELSDFGYWIALDDFGVESSNFQRLQSFPIKIVKLDRSLITNIDNDERKQRTLSALATLLQNLGHKCIVEGVETAGEAQFLRANKLEVQQGFLHSKPMTPEEIIDHYYN